MKSSRQNCSFWGTDPGQKLYVRSYGDFVLVPQDTETSRTVDFGEIFWPVSGRASFRLLSRDFIVRPGYVWYYPPGSHHEYYPVDVFHYCWMTVAGENAGMFFKLLGLVPGLNKSGECPANLFAQLNNDLENHTVMHRVNALNTAFRILSQISIGRRAQKAPEDSMDEVRRLIDTTFMDPDLSVARLAENVHIHRVSLSRGFSRAFGTTVLDYITHTRLQSAMVKLKKTDLSVAQIAESCGFHSSNYFSKVFFSKMGVPPLLYRQRHSEAKDKNSI